MNFRETAKVILFLVTGPLAGFSCDKQEKAPSPPEIRQVVLISIDTCRADYLSCYGYPRKTTPHLDAVAAQGVLCENVITTIPLTLPAHCSMMTGTIPPYHGVHANQNYRLSDVNITLAELLRDRGFTTAAIVSSFTLNSVYGTNQGFDRYDDEFEAEIENDLINQRRGDEISLLACQWLQQHQNDAFFLFLHYFDPHALYVPPEPFASRFSDNLYAGEIAYTDHCIGQVLDQLKSLDLYDSALIIITGDHGEMLGEHGEDSHGYYLYQSALRVPLIIKPARQRGKAQQLKTTVGLIDVAPTILGSLGIAVPKEMQGVDLSEGFLSGRKKISAPQRDFFCEASLPMNYGCSPLQGLVTDQWKYLRAPRPELFNLDDDPQEKNDLARQQPEQLRRMEIRLKKILAQQSRSEPVDNTFTMSPQAQLRLQSLGYIAGSAPATLEFDPTKPDPKDFIVLHANVSRFRGYVALEKYDQAKELAQKMLLHYPDSFDVHLCLGVIAFARGELDTAVEHYQKCVQISPDNLIARYHLGRALARAGKSEQAIAQFEETLRINPQAYKAHLDIAAELIRQNQPAEAVSHFRQALSINPDSELAHTHLASTLARQNQLDEAVIHYTQALRVNPKNAITHTQLAQVLSQQGKFEQAISHWKTALQLKPDMPRVHLPLALALSQIGQTDQAIPHLHEALRYDPNNADAHAGLAVALALQNQLAPAIAHYRRVLELRPDDPGVLTNLGKALAQQGRLDDALDQWNLAVSLIPPENPQHQEVRLLLAQQLTRHGRLAEALTHWQALVPLAPDDYRILFNAGMVNYQLGRFEQARHYWNRLLELNPDYLQALERLAWLLATNENAEIRAPARAVDLAQRACRLSDFQQADILDTLAAAYAAAGRFDQAVETARDALNLVVPAQQQILATQIQHRLELYQQGKAYVDVPQTQNQNHP